MTDRAHFENLTEINVPFGLLDDDTQERLKAWAHGWQLFNVHGNWLSVFKPFWNRQAVYRALPEPNRKPSVNWDHVAKRFNVLTVDGVEQAMLWKSSPSPWPERMIWSGKGPVYDANAFESLDIGSGPWHQRIAYRPGYEPEADGDE